MAMSSGLCEELGFAHMQAANRSDRTAVEFILEWADQENPLAHGFSALLYYYGIIVPEDEDKAAEIAGRSLTWLESVVTSCQEATPTNLPDPAYPYVLYILGLYLYWGIGIAKDWPRHFQLLKKGEVFAYPPMYCSLGYCYKDGEGTEVNSTEAVRLFRLAANAGYAAGMKNLGDCFKNGFGVHKDINEAMRYYRKASYLGLDIAMQALAEVYYRGVEVEEDSAAAFKWFKLAAEKGDTHSEYTLGWYHENGVGIPLSHQLALEWYRKAAAKRHVSSKVAAAELLFRISADMDTSDEDGGYIEAISYANLAIEEFKKLDLESTPKPSATIARAYFLLARCHLHGKGYPQSEPEALKYLHLSLRMKADLNLNSYNFQKFALAACKHNHIPLIRHFIRLIPPAHNEHSCNFTAFLHNPRDIANCLQVTAELGMPLSGSYAVNIEWPYGYPPVELYGELDEFVRLLPLDKVITRVVCLDIVNYELPSLKGLHCCYEQGLLAGLPLEERGMFASRQSFWQSLQFFYPEDGGNGKVTEWKEDVYQSLVEWEAFIA